MSTLPTQLLELLVCPQCHGSLAWDYESAELVCSAPSCGLAYPVRKGIPVLLVDEARGTRTLRAGKRPEPEPEPS